eukprot:15967037-Heterocapsa_arctica.AAC.1
MEDGSPEQLASQAMAAWDATVASNPAPAFWELTQKNVELQESIQTLADKMKTLGVVAEQPAESDVPAGKFQKDLKDI